MCFKRLLPIYAYSLFNELVFIYAFYAVMFSDHGLSPFQISILLAVWSTTTFVLEIPSGALADKYSRKHVLLVAQIAKVCGFTCWLVFPTFWGFLIGFVGWGIRSAFSSGSFEALVYDELKQSGDQDSYAKIIGRCRSLNTIGVLTASIAAAAMIRFGYGFLLAASLVPLLISCGAVLLMPSAQAVEHLRESEYFAVLKQGAREAFHNRTILRLIMFLSFGIAIFGSLEEYWSLFYKQAGISMAGIAILNAVVSAACVAAQAIAYRFNGVPDRVFFAAYSASGALLLIASFFIRPISVLCIPLICAVSVITDIVLEARLQHAISGDARATVLSVRGFLSEVAAVHIYMGFGAVACRWGYPRGFMSGAAVIMAIGALYMVFGGQRPFAKRAESAEEAVELQDGRV